MSKRILTPQELTQLARHGMSGANIENYGETPVEYITGRVEFCGHDFLIDERALIPRVETEELTALALKECEKIESDPVGIAEIGTGSGAVALSLALEFEKRQKNYYVVATDVSGEALELAQENNQQLLPVPQHGSITFIESNLFANVPSNQFDLIIANLPYIPSERIAYLDPSVKDYEPHVALDGGEDGLRLIYSMIEQAKNYAKPGTIILLEVDYTHTADSFSLFSNHWHIETIVDQFLRQRFVKLTLQ